ncbi:BglG family transcription antiterminator [Jeotgalibaca caeni]|uniref:BglG family transcription antiterminator n=1 Tax=Jeotgalibaca caeni TaxID=3028623 RepID=UPI00237DC197|nr:BglG family transcription antiterminator [Jeotgalibaca caeni]MDE1548138.1 BglG family transcription antiterminator [Jeotgalibaca caeni]
MENRLSALFWKCCTEEQKVAIADVARAFEVTERTVYSDIKKLNELLKNAGHPSLELQKGIIHYPVVLDVAFHSLLDVEELSLTNPWIRRLRLLRRMLTIPEPFSLDNLAEEIQLSRNTLLRDLQSIREELSLNNITLHSRPFIGFSIEGDETMIRALLVSVITEDTLFREDDPQHDVFLNKAERFLLDLMTDVRVEISEDSFERLLHHVWVVKERLALKKTMEPGDYLPQHTKEELVFLEKRATLEQLMGVPLGTSDILYLAQKFSEASVVRYDALLSEKWVPFSLVVSRLIKRVADKMNLPALQQDDQLFTGLLNHLRPAYQRATAQEVVENPLYDYVVSEHGNLLESVEDALIPFKYELGVTFTSQEASFFTLFFASSLERNRKAARRLPTVILVCNAGLSTSVILQSKLEASYHLHILGAFGKRRAHQWLTENEVDFIISTVPFQSDTHPVLQVQPYLSINDRKRLEERVESLSRRVDVQEVMGLVKKYATVNQSGQLEKELSRYFGVQHTAPHSKGVYQPMLLEVLTEELIRTNVLCHTRDEAVRASGDLLVANGHAKPGYVDAMIENVEENGTYIVIAPGIAMPHARPEKGALDIGLSIVTLKEPVVFGHPKNDPVRLVIGLCAIDHQTHLLALSELVEILANEATVNELLQAQSPEEAMTIIKGGV